MENKSGGEKNIKCSVLFDKYENKLQDRNNKPINKKIRRMF